jgi:hypothetical protein
MPSRIPLLVRRSSCAHDVKELECEDAVELGALR